MSDPAQTRFLPWVFPLWSDDDQAGGVALVPPSEETGAAVIGDVSVVPSLLGLVSIVPSVLGTVMVNVTNRVHISEDNDVSISSLRLASNSSAIDNATVNMDLKDIDGTVIGGLAGVSLTLDTTGGNYRGTLSSTGLTTTCISVDQPVYLEITATTTAGNDAFRRARLNVEYHGLESI